MQKVILIDQLIKLLPLFFFLVVCHVMSAVGSHIDVRLRLMTAESSVVIASNIVRKLLFKVAKVTTLTFNQVLYVHLTQLVLALLLMLVKLLKRHQLVTEGALALQSRRIRLLVCSNINDIA